MNSYQLKQTARSRRNNAQKLQRPLLNFKASKDKAKDRRKSSSNDAYNTASADLSTATTDHTSTTTVRSIIILLLLVLLQVARWS